MLNNIKFIFMSYIDGVCTMAAISSHTKIMCALQIDIARAHVSLHIHFQQAGASYEPAKPDAVLEYLLRNVRSKNVRRTFFSSNPAEYTEEREVRVLVSEE